MYLCVCVCVCVCVGGGGGGGGGGWLVYYDTSRRLWCAHDAWLRAIWFLAKLALIRCSRIWILLLPSQVYMVLSHRLQLRPNNCMNCTSKYIWGLQKPLYILFYDFRTRVYESPVCSFLHIYLTFLMFLLRACNFELRLYLAGINAAKLPIRLSIWLWYSIADWCFDNYERLRELWTG